MDFFIFIIVVILIWLLTWLIYHALLKICENSKFRWIRLFVWLPLHEWNLLWEYIFTNEPFDPYGAYGACVMTFSWFEKKMFMAGWYDYIAKQQNPITNSMLSLSYEYELLVDNVNVSDSGNCSCCVLYNNESTTLEEYDDHFVIGAYVTSSQPVIVPNFLNLMQSVLTKKYNDFQFQTIESGCKQKQTILFSRHIAKDGSYSFRHWQTKYNLLDILSSFSSVRKDCVRILNMRSATLEGYSNGCATSLNLLENMQRITG